jgi:hypothetical protein
MVSSTIGKISEITTAISAAIAQQGVAGFSGPRHRLQALERQAFGILDAGEIKPADEGRDGIAITVGQRNHGIDGDSLGLHGLPHVLNLDRESVRLAD